MLRAPEPFLLLIADVSGYTSYLAGTELDHAQDVLADLLDVVARHLEPPFELSSVEGDACFLLAPDGTVSGQLLLDTLDSCYFAFRRRLRDIGHATSCPCNACSRIPDLDLKFVVHHGQAIRQRVGRQENLTGPAVITVHRLLKNDIPAHIGGRGYAFFSDDAASVLGLGCARMGMLRHGEDTDLGRIDGYVTDMRERWDAEDRRIDGRLPADQVLGTIETVLPAPPPIAWEWITSPRLRPCWQSGVSAVIVADGAPRLDAGVVNHCMHGPDAIIDQIVDWRPFDSVTDRSIIPGALTLVTTFELWPDPAGTRVRFTAGGLETDEERAVWATMGEWMRAKMEADLAQLAELLRTGAGGPPGA